MDKQSLSYFFFRATILSLLDTLFLPVALLASLLARLFPKRVDVGLGPMPIINSPYHKAALESVGYRAETYCYSVWHTTSDFDVRADGWLPGGFKVFRPYFLFLWQVFRYRCLYIYFGGAALTISGYLWRFEPALLRLAGIRTVVMAYGSDVHDLKHCSNLLFKHVMSIDYPHDRFGRRRIAERIDMWVRFGDHVIGGCDWVYYLPFWHTLMISHFAIDTNDWRPLPAPKEGVEGGSLRVLHAPNHRALKGTEYIIKAIEELKAEGMKIELVLLEGVPNWEVRQKLAEADVVVDQLIVGWYAMFAIEAMSLGKPVICHLRTDLLELYEAAGLLEPGELPLINADWRTIKEVLRRCAEDRDMLLEVGERSRDYVVKQHSLEAIGAEFDKINRKLGIKPRNIGR